LRKGLGALACGSTIKRKMPRLSRRGLRGNLWLPRKNALFMLIMLIVVIVPVISLEIMARIFFPQPTLLYISSNNYRLIYELNPLYPEINSFGMRNEEFDPSTLRNQFIIAVIGDSHTYGERSKRREDTFPSRLEHYLKAMTGGDNIKVLNFGVPGYDMHQELEVLRAKVLRFNPDLIILQYCINDEHISNYIQPKYVWLNRTIHKSVLLSQLWENLLYSDFGKNYILSYVEEYFPDLLLYSPGLVGTLRPLGEKDPAHMGHPPRSRDEVPVRYWDFIGRKNLERDVRIFGELSKKAGIPAIATGFIEDQHRTLYETAGFKVYSFFQIFHGLDMRDYGYNPAKTGNHFTDRGSDFIGKNLADFIDANFALPQRSLVLSAQKRARAANDAPAPF
jgi:lysophospholipase L1-like esterase